MEKVIGSVMVIGGGIAGIQASLDLAESGFKVFLVESAPSIGGNMARLDKTFPTNECAMCVISPKLVDCGRHINIELVTYSELVDLKGDAGDFKAAVLRKPSYVDFSKCNGCGDCAVNCPVSLDSEFDFEIGKRNAIYRLYPQAVPNVFVIDKNERPPCHMTCPSGINAQGYIALASVGKYKEAYELIRNQVPFPSVLGRICHHPCELKCNRKDVDEAISINAIKRFLCDWYFNNNQVMSFPDIPQREEKIAVIGAGPSGLTCAHDLARSGYKVTVFEAEDTLGGMLSFGIPKYRLPREILERDLKGIIDKNITIEKAFVGKDLTLNDILKNGFKAIYLSVGMQSGKKLNIEGIGLKGVFSGLDFLRSVGLNKEYFVKGKVVVIGGGNVAIDTALTAKRLGAESVSIVCLEKMEEMPAYKCEIEQALAEGVIIYNSYGPKKIKGDNDVLNSVECLKCRNVFDTEGRFNPSFTEGTEKTFDADTIFMAVGQDSELLFLKGAPLIKISKMNTIVVDPITMETGMKGVFAGGDIVTGPRSVVEAIAQGKDAAVSIDRYLQGKDMKYGREKQKAEPAGLPLRKIIKQPRQKMPLLPVGERKNNFREIETGLSAFEIQDEIKRCVNCGACSMCLECEKVCKPGAIRHDMKPEQIEYNVGAIILATGFNLFQAENKREYGFGIYKNVVTSIQFERLLASSGPTSGEILRPSDGKHPKKIAFIQCVGSRDINSGNEYCSSVCCMQSTKEAIISREHDKNISPTIFFIDIRTFGKDYDKYYESAENENGVRYIRSMVSKIYEDPKTENLMVRYVGGSKIIEEEFDLVVLAIGLVSSPDIVNLAGRLGVELDKYNFVSSDRVYYNLTNKPGVFVSGCSMGPQDIPDSVASGSSGASFASALLSKARGSLVKKKKYPVERDISAEDLRIGVFICHCGRNISSVVNINNVVEAAQRMPNVVYAGDLLYTCSQDGLDEIKKKIAEYKLNRVVVASCTPRTHEVLFRDTIKEAGLNPYLFEMTSIREQCSWVHKDIPMIATQKASELVSMIVEKVRLAKPLRKKLFAINHNCLVIGGGIAGLSAALSAARQGCNVFLVEKEKELGGVVREMFFTLSGWDPQNLLKNLIQDVINNERIKIFLNGRINETKGHVGDFVTMIEHDGITEEIKHGAAIVAAGANENRTDEYRYGSCDRIMTQKELEKMIIKDPKSFIGKKTVVMIQCVSSRDDKRPYCSRVCCGHALKNAIKLKGIDPAISVYVIYRDIRTYGTMERYYLDAREKGVIFVRYEKDKKPVINITGGRIDFIHMDPFLEIEMKLNPDLLILSVGMVTDNAKELSQKLKVPLNSDDFFLEAHPKIRPLDFTAEGIFLCGTCHSPRYVEEAIVQANGAAMRAVTLLSKDEIETRVEIAKVNERLCTGCGVCVTVCPYNAREIDDDKKVAKVMDILCQGCGACAISCPSGATEHECFHKKQILSMVDMV